MWTVKRAFHTIARKIPLETNVDSSRPDKPLASHLDCLGCTRAKLKTKRFLGWGDGARYAAMGTMQ